MKREECLAAWRAYFAQAERAGIVEPGGISELRAAFDADADGFLARMAPFLPDVLWALVIDREDRLATLQYLYESESEIAAGWRDTAKRQSDGRGDSIKLAANLRERLARPSRASAEARAPRKAALVAEIARRREAGEKNEVIAVDLEISESYLYRVMRPKS